MFTGHVEDDQEQESEEGVFVKVHINTIVGGQDRVVVGGQDRVVVEVSTSWIHGEVCGFDSCCYQK